MAQGEAADDHAVSALLPLGLRADDLAVQEAGERGLVCVRVCERGEGGSGGWW